MKNFCEICKREAHGGLLDGWPVCFATECIRLHNKAERLRTKLRPLIYYRLGYWRVSLMPKPYGQAHQTQRWQRAHELVYSFNVRLAPRFVGDIAGMSDAQGRLQRAFGIRGN